MDECEHNTYLASLEASFVKELHPSLGLLSSHSEYSDQFTVLQDGFSRRINFDRCQPLPYNAAGSHFVKESSWMQRFRCSIKHDNILVNLRDCSTFCSEEMLSGRKRIFTHRLRTAMRIRHESKHDAVCNIAEVSDQNFVDEDQEEKSLNLSRPKRLKMDAADYSTNDQMKWDCLQLRSMHKHLDLPDSKIKVPAMLIMGEEDYVFKFPGMEDYIRSGEVKTDVPNLETIYAPEGSHFVQEQFPDQVNQLLLTFLNSHS